MNYILSTLSALVFSLLLSISSVYAQSATLTSPTSSAAYSATMPLNYTVTDPGGTPVSITLVMFNTDSSLTYTYDLGTATSFNSSLSVTSNLAVPDGTYNIHISFVPFGGGPSVTSSTASSVRFDRVTLTPTLSAPIGPLTTSGNFTLAYTLPEIPSASAVSLTFNNGSSNVATTTMSSSQTVSGTFNAKSIGSFPEVVSTSLPSLPDGTYSIILSYQDVLANPAATASVSSITIDSVAPSAPTITTPAAGAYFKVQAVSIGGTAEVGSSVKVYDGGVLQQTLTTDGSGNWSYTTSSLTEGSHSITATATDVALNVSSTSSLSFTYDASTPSAPAILAPTDRSTTTQTSYQLSGTGEVGATIAVYDSNDTSMGTTTVDSAGVWQLTVSSLTLGKNTFYTTATDLAQNLSNRSSSVSLFRISGAPYAPLDISGDGFSEFVRIKRTSSSVAFKWTNPVTKVRGGKNLSATKGLAAMGDYDGDGGWEFGTITKEVGGAVNWKILSSANSLSSESFGKTGDAILVGCNFDSVPDTELAYVRSNILSFKQLQGSVTSIVTLPRSIKQKAIRGCGDLNGDGVDELFFEQTISKKKYVVAYSVQAARILKSEASNVATVFAGDFAKTSIKEMAVSYKPTNTVKVSLFSSLAKQKEIVLSLPTSVGISPAKCSVPGSVADCILYTAAKSQVFKYLPKTNLKKLVGSLEKGYTLLPSRAVYIP
jgi:hypothetical protein